MSNFAANRSKIRLLGYAATIFLSSALLLVLEIVAGRLIAPYVGVSLYTWTSIIGVILAGLSLGNWAGGVWADRGASEREAGLVLAGAGIYCLLSLALLPLVGDAAQSRGLSLLSASFLLAAVLFATPAALIGVVTPLLTTLALRLDDRTGHVVGRMHALAAIGSILGTFLAGYWLIQTFGTRTVIFGAGTLLTALGLSYLRLGSKALAVAVLGGAVGTAGVVALKDGLASSCERESAYFCIRVADHSAHAPFGEARGLVLDHLLHGINHAELPELLIAPYIQALDELVRAHFGDGDARALRWLFAGGGAYSLPRAVRAMNPKAEITVAELDPAVTETARDRLFVSTEGMRILHQDARLVLQQKDDSFDVIIGDVFHDLAIPYHLVTREFVALVHQRLRPGGIYAMNLVDTFPDPKLLKAVIKTLRAEFKQVDIWMEGPPEAERVTFVITASDVDQLPDRVVAQHGIERAWHRVSDMVDRVGVPMSEIPMLTDDYAPVESLIAGLLVGENR
ncbi:hypothetical protein G3480_07045 [Thiorhodococcus mannitoliphagus]|uniref:PABS domain-containing protein n=1 Tax=Thiorhodococcus mannitoliphagus TaxID=329406 RepID=A0A6P1DVH5_9GAMM|nr:fused MFS/spermidine synthase [Thiorhodococcus mannitoliphagus]NEX20072.1 hypothetical protein [Thiorhodococcus mannitoliphagus]